MMDMSLALAAARNKAPCQRIRILANAEFADGVIMRERFRHMFHSPLGSCVSEAQRDGCALRLEFNVASEDLAFMLRTLRHVLPEARVIDVIPRVFAHRPHA